MKLFRPLAVLGAALALGACAPVQPVYVDAPPPVYAPGPVVYGGGVDVVIAPPVGWVREWGDWRDPDGGWHRRGEGRWRGRDGGWRDHGGGDRHGPPNYRWQQRSGLIRPAPCPAGEHPAAGSAGGCRN